MRVKLTTSCNLEEVPGMVIRSLFEVKSKLLSMSDTSLNYFSVEDLTSQIAELRYELSDLDQALEEAHNIAAGYSSALNGPTAEEDIAEEKPLDEEEI